MASADWFEIKRECRWQGVGSSLQPVRAELNDFVVNPIRDLHKKYIWKDNVAKSFWKHQLARMAKIWFKSQTELLSNDKGLVPKGGLEPPRVAPYAPQTYVSTSSTTSARSEDS